MIGVEGALPPEGGAALRRLGERAQGGRQGRGARPRPSQAAGQRSPATGAGGARPRLRGSRVQLGGPLLRTPPPRPVGARRRHPGRPDGALVQGGAPPARPRGWLETGRERGRDLGAGPALGATPSRPSVSWSVRS